ncbi:MAG: PQQ-dependent sugar dehydrogenase [Gammaproteobacteria bacterium]|nr:PQQ-dependent sugar dehydrogenase [Gammaproteobacteria bacterium]MDH5799200.1 PQQ-dependent sugar dehydrogenase [Gammaproteobacteria bacterium]
MSTIAVFFFSSIATATEQSESNISYDLAFNYLSFNNPTYLLQEPSNGQRWFLTEKSGIVYSFANAADTKVKNVYIDISSRVDHSFEGGLLGMAFDPEFSQNRFVYLSYTSSSEPQKDNSKTLISRISRFRADAENLGLDPSSELIIFSLDQPWNNHNGGHIAFGPDKFLYAGFGDGGSWGDPNNNAQNTSTILGSMIRIDVRNASAKKKYRIPKQNPFSSNRSCSDKKGCPEIFAWGFRNPWRWSFDLETGQLWMGDVGQGNREEINRVELGKNYGWNCYEGNADYRNKPCNPAEYYEKPVLDYKRFPVPNSRHGHAASVTGGYVYRGQRIPSAKGVYFYADFVVGKVWGLRNPYSDLAENQLLFDTDYQIVSFAQDNEGELYFLSFSNQGRIYKLRAKQ